MTQTTKQEALELRESCVLRPLACNDTGRKWLKELRKREVPVASRFAAMPEALRNLEYRSTLLYTSVLSPAERRRILQNEIEGIHILKGDHHE